MRVESHPYIYPLDDRFPDRCVISKFEGGELCFAEKDGKYFAITDEGTLADFLSPEDGDMLATLINVYELDSEAEREKYIQKRGWRKPPFPSS
jgi:hypothetical protein